MVVAEGFSQRRVPVFVAAVKVSFCGGEQSASGSAVDTCAASAICVAR